MGLNVDYVKMHASIVCRPKTHLAWGAQGDSSHLLHVLCTRQTRVGAPCSERSLGGGYMDSLLPRAGTQRQKRGSYPLRHTEDSM